MKIRKFFDADPGSGIRNLFDPVSGIEKFGSMIYFLIFFNDRLASDKRFTRYRENKCLPDRLSAPGTLSFK
jgi:hypothetical protein